MTDAERPGSGAGADHGSRFYREYVDQSSVESVGSRLARLGLAREEWCRHLEDGADELSTESLFRHLFPHPSSSEGGWTHPFGDEAKELTAWHAAWSDAPAAKRERVVRTVLAALQTVRDEPSELNRAIASVTRSFSRTELPLAALTPGFSALQPDRLLALSETCVQILALVENRRLSIDLADYVDLNATALRWLAASEHNAPSKLLQEHPRADRFSSFCDWFAVAKRGVLARSPFAVAAPMYKDWPPMW